MGTWSAWAVDLSLASLWSTSSLVGLCSLGFLRLIEELMWNMSSAFGSMRMIVILMDMHSHRATWMFLATTSHGTTRE